MFWLIFSSKLDLVPEAQGALAYRQKLLGEWKNKNKLTRHYPK